VSSWSLADVPVDDDECLARFVFDKRHIPKAGSGIKAEAMLPFKWTELSVTRHRELSEAEISLLGREVANQRSTPERKFKLLGRADFLAQSVRRIRLDAKPDEPPRNHANIIKWPTEKSAQMSLAQELAALAEFKSLPSNETDTREDMP
jgi:hypothetical protein